jgi:hypothetical protein
MTNLLITASRTVKLAGAQPWWISKTSGGRIF